MVYTVLQDVLVFVILNLNDYLTVRFGLTGFLSA